MEKKKYTCIVCPKSCTGTLIIKDNGELETKGYDCENGKKYAINEYTDPKRMLTTTVRVTKGVLALLPVVSSEEISKLKLKDCIHYLYDICVCAPIKEGQIIVKNILGTGVNIVAARDIKKIGEKI